MKVKTSYVPTNVDYLTVNKEYKVESLVDDFLAYIEDDNDEDRAILLNGCAHLDGKPWEIIK